MGAAHVKEGRGGYRIVRICPEGPMSECDVEIFFDYIVQIEDVKLQDASRKTYESFMQKVREGENKEVRLLVYSCRYDKLKEVHVKPRRWRGKGLLGMNISYEKANTMNEGIQIVRIEDGYLDVKNKVTEKEDIIIGHEENILRNCDELCNFVEANLSSYHRGRKQSPLELSFYVYNKRRGDVRKVKMQVDPTWARHGLLGCHVSEMNASLEEGRGNHEMNREVAQEVTPYERCNPQEHVTTAEWAKHLPGEPIEWGAEPSVGSNHIRFGSGEENGGEAQGEEPESPQYGRFNTHYFRDGSGAGRSLERSLGNSPGGVQDHKVGGTKSYALSSTIEVEAEGNQDMGAKEVLSDASSGREKRKGKHVKQLMQPSQRKHTLHTSSTSQEWHPPPDERDTPAERYERYVQNMKTYSKEMIEVYKDMDENGKLLEELKLRMFRNFTSGGKLVGEECDYLDGEGSLPVEGLSEWALQGGDTSEGGGTCEVQMDGKSQAGGDGILT
ncbi:Uncharacterized protein PCOAH_00015290 [Plasmodium coatneyi]|uniref:PDZ GRASP-type domain-containing protein n=1 Tax=Plasmodium coatneyi TaxID=208452 RepID=A0A1B1DW18_9APIC|nr:Uncharacterized protein PCOAH_00015290 [Plasmodium coatneyi]ANQ06972.1 Uncharacterized protein PCOAH_00015290 [Plasmodium coatneyi]